MLTEKHHLIWNFSNDKTTKQDFLFRHTPTFWKWSRCYLMDNLYGTASLWSKKRTLWNRTFVIQNNVFLCLTYCYRGKTRGATEGCVVSDPKVGHIGARRILKDHHGQPFRDLIGSFRLATGYTWSDVRLLPISATNMQKRSTFLNHLGY